MAHGPLSVALASAEELDRVARGDAGRVLLAIRYGSPRAAVAHLPFPVLDVPNRILDAGPAVELWRSSEPVRVRTRGRFACAESDHAMFAAAVCPVTEDLEADTFALYRELLAVAAEAAFPALQRLWNCIPGINGPQRGEERYKLFSAGRALGYEDRFGPGAERHFPASSAVGTSGDALIVWFLAGRDAGRHHENPRQVSAFRYPSQYGTRSPSFARGTLAPGSLGNAFFLSGTASVVGHESRHEGDVLRQLDETLRNIDALSTAVAVGPEPPLSRFQYLRVYIRRPSDFDAVRNALTQRLGTSTVCLYLQAEICRAELLLEIEGVALQPTVSRPRM